MEQHNTDNHLADTLLLIVSLGVGAIAHLTTQDGYYAIGCVSFLIVIIKNIWEWREKMKNQTGNDKGN
jgi:bacteriorhodopsin